MASEAATDNDFMLKEADFLRRELDDTIKTIWETERQALLLTGAIWAWSLPNHTPTFTAVKWLPLGLNLLFGLRSLALYRHVNRISYYLLFVEKRFNLSEGIGWEQHFRKNSDLFTLSTAYIFWICLLLAGFIVPIVFK
jgi:hypothetical protein